MSYYELPKKKNQIIALVAIIISYVSIFFIADTLFPEIEPDVKKKLSQGGLTAIFVSGLLASMDYFWTTKVKHNLEFAEFEVQKYEEYLEILTIKLSDNPTDQTAPIESHQLNLNNAMAKLQEAKDHPNFLVFSGKLSVFILACGTLLCIIGEG